MVVICESNLMTDVRPCTIRDEHTVECDGLERRWSEDQGSLVATGRKCEGCEPRPARFGFVCGACYDRAVAGEAAYLPWARALKGVERAVTPERGRSSAVGFTPLSVLDLDLDAIGAAHESFPGSVDAWVSTWRGAEDAIRFGRLMTAATRTHPVRELPHKLRRTWCPSCRKPTFVWHPPTYEGGPVKVECKSCGFVAPPSIHDDIVHIEELARRS